MAMNAMDAPGLARFWNGLKAKLNSKADLVDGKVPASQLPASSGYAPVVLTCAITENDISSESDTALVYATVLTRGTYAQALAAAEAGTPAILQIARQSEDEGTQELVTDGYLCVSISYTDDGGVGGAAVLDDETHIIADIDSTGTVTLTIAPSGGDSAQYIDISLELTEAVTTNFSTDPSPITLPSGTYAAAQTAIISGRDVKVRLTLTHSEGDVSTPVVRQVIPLRRVQLDTGAAWAAIQAAKSDADADADGDTAAPDFSAYYSIIGETEIIFDTLMILANSDLTQNVDYVPSSYPIPFPMQVVLAQDDTATFALQTDQLHITIPVVWTELADDANIGTEDSPQTVAAYKEDVAVDAVYRMAVYKDGQAQESLEYVLNYVYLLAAFLDVQVTIIVDRIRRLNGTDYPKYLVNIGAGDYITGGYLYQLTLKQTGLYYTRRAVTL